MGLITNSMRLQQLSDARHDVERDIQEITNSKLENSKDQADLADRIATASMNGEKNPEVKALEAHKLQIELMEKKLDAKLARCNSRLQAIQTETESAKKIQEYEIQASFTYGGRQ